MTANQRTAQLLVGADNMTGELDLPRIETIVSKRHQGFTLWQASGYWQGNQEPTAVILLSGTSDSIASTISDLKSELSQDAVGVISFPAMTLA